MSHKNCQEAQQHFQAGLLGYKQQRCLLCGRLTCKQVTVSYRHKTHFLSWSLSSWIQRVAFLAVQISCDHAAFVPVIFWWNLSENIKNCCFWKVWIHLALTIIAATALSNQVLMQNLIVLVMIFSANKQSTSKKMAQHEVFHVPMAPERGTWTRSHDQSKNIHPTKSELV